MIETDDGRSRLAYPAGPVATPATRPTLVITFAEAGRWDGSLDLTPTPRPIETPRSTGDAWRDAVVAVFTMPGFLAQPFVGLPDRLAANLDGPGPVAPAVLDLARDLVEYRGIAAIGTVRNTGVLACRLTTTDAGRAKLSAALARRSSATPRPS